MALLALAEAQAELLALAPALEIEHRAVSAACGFYLASDLKALTSRPEAPTSAMDGYAICHGDGAGPWTIVGESAAGHPWPGALGLGQAVRIATGALLPDTADTVVIQEDCAREGLQLLLAGALPATGANVRAPGGDFRHGDTLLAAGSPLGPAALGLALAAGHAAVAVRRTPRIAVIDSGDELVAAGAPRRPGQTTASNAPMLAALLSGTPAEVRCLGPIADRIEALVAALADCADADIVVTTGGASVGDHDLVRPALAAFGAELAFWKVAIKPGKPLLVAHKPRPGGHQLILGLPGNPASAFVTGYLFLLPLVRAALGAAEPLPRALPARLAAALPATGARAEYLRGRWDGEVVTPLALQDSGALRPLAAANALIVRPAQSPPLVAGSRVPIHLLRNGGIA